MVKEKLITAFSMVEIGSNELQTDTQLCVDLGMDSQEVIELHCNIEKLFGFELPDGFIVKDETFGSLYTKLNYLSNNAA